MVRPSSNGGPYKLQRERALFSFAEIRRSSKRYTNFRGTFDKRHETLWEHEDLRDHPKSSLDRRVFIFFFTCNRSKD